MSLADAIINEDIDQVNELLRYHFNINEIDEYGFTYLIEAAIADNIEIAKLLISHGADVNLQDMTGNTALHWAAENNNLTLAKILLQQRANPNAYNTSGQPVLVMPLLRQHNAFKKLLMQHGADLVFAQDFINTKLLGHMFELVGTANIVDPNNQFVEVDFEGFYLEVTLGIIADSLVQFRNHFAARTLRQYSQFTDITIEMLDRAARLIKYNQYRMRVEKHAKEIKKLIQQQPLLIPIGYEGHAITFLRWQDILVKCDRREDSRLYDNIVFYRMLRPEVFTAEFVMNFLYQKQTSEFINEDLHTLLQLQPLTELKIPAQISGNCSWANVEAAIPAAFFLLSPTSKTPALHFFNQWREWNKERALNFCIQSFYQNDSLRKACKAEILAAILFQTCQDEHINSERIQSILTILTLPEYEYILKNYIKVYCYESSSEEGRNFLRLLKKYGYSDKR